MAKGAAEVDLTEGATGQFDILVDGRVVFSRAATGRFPSAADLDNLAD